MLDENLQRYNRKHSINMSHLYATTVRSKQLFSFAVWQLSRWLRNRFIHSFTHWFGFRQERAVLMFTIFNMCNRKRILALFRGIHDWHVVINNSPSSMLVRFSSWKMAHLFL